MRIRRAGVGLARALKMLQGPGSRVADVKAHARAAQVALAVPAQVALHLVAGIELTPLDEAFRKAKGHGCVVGPLARFQAPRPAADHVRNGLKSTRPLELQRGAQRVAHREAEQRPAGPEIGRASWRESV